MKCNKIRLGSSMIKVMLLGGLVVLTSSCASSTRSATQVERRDVMADQRYSRDIPGVVEYTWEEPMVDVIDVPPGLDPEGNYYRPGHQAVVEIRQGRWQYYRARNQPSE